jgi:sugar fermentation stimulation protein A
MRLYDNIHEGTFLSRPNRFIAEVEINGKTERCHVKNTGRCKELLIPGTQVYVNRSDKQERTTKYDLVAVRKGERLVNIDSQAPNKAFLEHLQSGRYMDGITYIKPEAKYGDSRFDFYVETKERKIFMEVKGVTLETNGVAMFPDAPTERGIKHLQGLARCINDGIEAHVIFVIQMNSISHFSPNIITHPAFGTTLSDVIKSGVKATALDCSVTPDSLTINNPVQIILEM